jgi:ligand-binding sensor domain-containing protein
MHRLVLGQPNEVIGLSQNGIVIFNSNDQSFQKINKTNGLNDVGPSAAAFISDENTIVVGYQNGNIDILTSTQTINVPDFKLSNIIGNKAIHHIDIQDNLAYLSTGIGLLVLDLVEFEIKNTALLGDNGIAEEVLFSCQNGDMMFAVGPKKIVSITKTNPFLANFQNWDSVFNVGNAQILSATGCGQFLYFIVQEQNTFTLWKGDLSLNNFEPLSTINTNSAPRSIWCNETHITVSTENRYYIFNPSGEIILEDNQNDWLFLSPQHVIIDSKGTLWIGNQILGLGSRSANGLERMHTPTGPNTNIMRKVNPYNHEVWMATGNVFPWWGNTYTYCFQSAYIQNNWINESFGNGANTFGDGVFDVLDVAVDPTNNQRVLFGSWEEGLIERQPDGKINIFNSATGNNPLASSIDTSNNWTAVGSVQFDLDGNAWIGNSFSENPVVVYTKEKKFIDFNFSPLVGKADIIEQVFHSQAGYVYAIIRGKGVLAFNYNGTIENKDDDIYKLLVDKEGLGGLPTKDVYSIAEDLDGNIWLGTIKGVAIFYNQESIFSEDNFDAEQILITQDGNVQILLETEAINNIEIDGGNNKWIATQNNGVYRFSPDGLTQLGHYTKDNTPLPSNNVYDIGINQANGQIFFATDRGLIAYTGDATNFDNKMEKVFAYPNPVPSEYQGLIAIQGLAYNSQVRITDMTGKLLFSDKSEGGRCVWNGKDAEGNRPAAGVYIIMAGDSQGDVKNVCKIAFER